MAAVFIQRLPLVFLLIFSQQLVAAEILVVMAKDASTTQLNSRQLENIFRRKTLINKQGERWIPINLNINNPLRITFSKKLFKQHPKDMEAFWNIQYFKGISPPYVLSSEEAMLRFVSSTQGAIGYINACNIDSRVRVLLKLTIPENTSPACQSPAKKLLKK